MDKDRTQELSINEQDLTGREVVLKEGVLRFTGGFSERVVKCTGGFGCKPGLQGKAVFASWIHNEEHVGRIDRSDIERFATSSEIEEARQYQPKKYPITDIELRLLQAKAESMTYDISNDLKCRMSKEYRTQIANRIHSLCGYLFIIIRLLSERGYVGQLKNGLTRMAFTAVTNPNAEGLDDQWALGIAEEGTRGYWPYGTLDNCDSYEKAMDIADKMNKDILGIDERTAMVIVASTMRGGV